eukprot:CAMPEP_0119554306 /NCGR_PEP_ID=MMETSP1352-20130426/6838_1 /TAXON_ID=265584 /ORGANISM="Stauroneis constricta, Strain CCMP1120" /LENGTH=151 /DNA_ID=CAMNT_0007600879 /DNA_START=54 /DNA_END=505 /DNA_ORIENTATION=+
MTPPKNSAAPPPLSQTSDASATSSSTECPRQKKAGRGNNNQDPVLAVSTATEPTVINGKEEGKWEEGNHDHDDDDDDDGLESFEAMLRNIRKRQFADIFSAAGCVLDDGSFALGAASVTIEDAADPRHSSSRHEVCGQELPRQPVEDAFAV